MKLFGIFAAAASVAAKDGDRTWANQPEFITNPESWWNSDIGSSRLANIKDVVDEYFQTYELSSDDRNVVRVAKIWERHTGNTIAMMEKQRARCNGGRKRRGVVNGQFVLSQEGQQKAIDEIYWAMAKWVRNELWEACPNQTYRILRRLDRIMRIQYWQHCRLGLSSGGYCEWAYNGNPDSKNPRKAKWLNDLYGKTSDHVFQGKGCTPNLSCPLGGTIIVNKDPDSDCNGAQTCTYTVNSNCDNNTKTEWTCA